MRCSCSGLVADKKLLLSSKLDVEHTHLKQHDILAILEQGSSTDDEGKEMGGSDRTSSDL